MQKKKKRNVVFDAFFFICSDCISLKQNQRKCKSCARTLSRALDKSARPTKKRRKTVFARASMSAPTNITWLVSARREQKWKKKKSSAMHSTSSLSHRCIGIQRLSLLVQPKSFGRAHCIQINRHKSNTRARVSTQFFPHLPFFFFQRSSLVCVHLAFICFFCVIVNVHIAIFARKNDEKQEEERKSEGNACGKNGNVKCALALEHIRLLHY